MEATLSVLDAKTAALRRRSIRRYRPDPVPEELLRDILQAALRAPSAWNLQPWRLLGVRDAATKKALREAAFGQAQVEEAPVVLVLYADLEDALAHLDEVIHPGVQGEKREAQKRAIQAAFAGMDAKERAQWAAGQSYILLGYLLLLLEAHGLGSVPMLGFDPEKVKALLGLPAHVAIPALLPLGYPAEEGYPSHRLPLERVVAWR
ncbi:MULTISPECIES: nitroreductase family protein [Thermus]|jgi:nitroreductase|uniref:NADH dehydrogenase n=1 Tax=Thermus brockianus TaxID=56956 RepID=A0A1J0LUI4_THEBO|nr:nitroreductase family protein [Thermus brockianus]APD09770.1 NADH oxidase [Thermus brockianus]BDG16928.1 NADH dehydrogenase [Thermus brockianus]